MEIMVVEPPFSKLTMEPGQLVAEQVFLIHPSFLYFLRVLISMAGDLPQLSHLLLYTNHPAPQRLQRRVTCRFSQFCGVGFE